VGHQRGTWHGSGRPLNQPRQRRPPTDADWLDRLFANGSGIWDLFVVVFYLPVIMGSLLWIHAVGGEWWLWDRLRGDRPVADAAVGVVVGIGLVVASRLGERSGPGRRAARVLAHHMGKVSWPGLVLVGSSSAIGEELLFRGVLQPSMGLVVAAILFAVVHVPFREEMWPWTVQALLHGLLFGLAYELSEALVLPIVAHTAFNTLQLVRWKRLSRA